MKFDIHETDLLILPETLKELNYQWQFSDVKGQSWYNKQYMDIPFRSDLLEEIKNYFN